MPRASNVRIYTIKRLRTEYQGRTRWVPIGSVAVNDNGTGTVYLNHQDEIWQLFERPSERKEDDA